MPNERGAEGGEALRLRQDPCCEAVWVELPCDCRHRDEGAAQAVAITCGGSGAHLQVEREHAPPGAAGVEMIKLNGFSHSDS
jgi:hypothetical protein